MRILGIETSCDECSAAVVDNGRTILSNIIATQIEAHRPFYGVVPEIASRMHTEWIIPVVKEAIEQAGIEENTIDAVAVTSRPGLIGSLLVGMCFGKAFAFSKGIPFIGIDHIEAHLYAPHLEQDISYPYIGLLVSGGHSLITYVRDFDDYDVLGTTIDDACGEAFDKVAKFYDIGYPGGVAIDRLSKEGDDRAFNFPKPSLHKGDHQYDVSYSGLKTAAVNQLDLFWNGEAEKSRANIAASFQRAAIDIIANKAIKAARDKGVKKIVAGGGVSANSYLRRKMADQKDIQAIFPSLKLCTDNGAMIAGLSYHHLKKGRQSELNLNASARVPLFKKNYP
ncbi:MAG: tRNA (adenosine(37)-N6)-threonylcarbamoyltransferase complex transferase subunit TsaD [Spirochaetales bacterium]|nr:tRNA (adenosine(37)-N6)-threonylcarbamoyltransferase complex transferase subunit TsaD [Spirochaetales bacterium]